MIFLKLYTIFCLFNPVSAFYCYQVQNKHKVARNTTSVNCVVSFMTTQDKDGGSTHTPVVFVCVKGKFPGSEVGVKKNGL